MLNRMVLTGIAYYHVYHEQNNRSTKTQNNHSAISTQHHTYFGVTSDVIVVGCVSYNVIDYMNIPLKSEFWLAQNMRNSFKK